MSVGIELTFVYSLLFTIISNMTSSTVPQSIREVYDTLQTELVWIHGRWKMYRQLFGTNSLRIDLLNESAGTFFYQLQQLWADYIVLEICRLCDPVETCGHKNLVLRQIPILLDRQDHADLIKQLFELQILLDATIEPLRDRRNKKIAHNDLGCSLDSNDTAIPGVSRAMIEDCLRLLRQFMNLTGMHFGESEMAYEHFAMPSDGDLLLYRLKLASEMNSMIENDWTLRSRIDQGRWKNV